MNNATAVLFDVDGTLIDSTYLHTVTWWEAFRQAGHDVAMARIHRAIGMGADRLLTELLPPDRATEEDADLRARAHGAWQLQRVTDCPAVTCPPRASGVGAAPHGAPGRAAHPHPPGRR
jgi:beta-phosphoglucomutase-like phosphatase (HAD superfamily)